MTDNAWFGVTPEPVAKYVLRLQLYCLPSLRQIQPGVLT